MCGRIAMDRPARRRPVDQGDQSPVGDVDLLGIARFDGVGEAPEERLDLGAVAQILEPLPRCGSYALCLLLRVGHRVPSD